MATTNPLGDPVFLGPEQTPQEQNIGARTNRLERFPDFRPARPDELTRYGVAAGQVDMNSNRFYPMKGVPLGTKESTMLKESEDAIQAAMTTSQQLKRAAELNDIAYSGRLSGARKAIGSLIGSDDPAYVASEELDNLMGRIALGQLKVTFPGAISDSERQVMIDLQGSTSKPREVRSRIWANAIPALGNVISRNSARIEAIKNGYYQTRNAAPRNTDQ